MALNAKAQTNNTHTLPHVINIALRENNLAKGASLSVLTRIQILKDQIRSQQPCPKESKMVKIPKHTFSNHKKNDLNMFSSSLLLNNTPEHRRIDLINWL